MNLVVAIQEKLAQRRNVGQALNWAVPSSIPKPEKQHPATDFANFWGVSTKHVLPRFCRPTTPLWIIGSPTLVAVVLEKPVLRQSLQSQRRKKMAKNETDWVHEASSRESSGRNSGRWLKPRCPERKGSSSTFFRPCLAQDVGLWAMGQSWNLCLRMAYAKLTRKSL